MTVQHADEFQLNKLAVLCCREYCMMFNPNLVFFPCLFFEYYLQLLLLIKWAVEHMMQKIYFLRGLSDKTLIFLAVLVLYYWYSCNILLCFSDFPVTLCGRMSICVSCVQWCHTIAISFHMNYYVITLFLQTVGTFDMLLSDSAVKHVWSILFIRFCSSSAKSTNKPCFREIKVHLFFILVYEYCCFCLLKNT